MVASRSLDTTKVIRGLQILYPQFESGCRLRIFYVMAKQLPVEWYNSCRVASSLPGLTARLLCTSGRTIRSTGISSYRISGRSAWHLNNCCKVLWSWATNETGKRRGPKRCSPAPASSGRRWPKLAEGLGTLLKIEGVEPANIFAIHGQGAAP